MTESVKSLYGYVRCPEDKRPYVYDPDCPLTSTERKKVSDLSPEQIERIKAAQKRHAVFDPGCEKLTLEEFINWHPVGGISWEERARRMKEREQVMQNQEAPIIAHN